MVEATWKPIQNVEGATAYNTQNLVKFKWNRLLIWTRPEKSIRFSNPTLQKRKRPGNGPPRKDPSNCQFLLGGAVEALGLEREW
ncbi:hypothetical protein PI125_g9500 [Phytophthora idaei]|nr:hypothetical protein PI125_g9500 [Phytophthora idaei]